MKYSTVPQMFNQVTLDHKDRELYFHKTQGSWQGITGSEIRSTVKNLAFAFQSIEIGKGSGSTIGHRSDLVIGVESIRM